MDPYTLIAIVFVALLLAFGVAFVALLRRPTPPPVDSDAQPALEAPPRVGEKAGKPGGRAATAPPSHHEGGSKTGDGRAGEARRRREAG
jgi:hypothetical protein